MVEKGENAPVYSFVPFINNGIFFSKSPLLCLVLEMEKLEI